MSVSEERREDATTTGPPPVGLIIASMLGIVAWLIFILIFALEWSRGYSLFQNLIVTVVSFAVAGILIGVMWVAFAPKGYMQQWRQ